MSNLKYEKGEQILTMREFAESKSEFYILSFGGKFLKRHRQYVASLQYRYIETIINMGNMFEAKLKEGEE